MASFNKFEEIEAWKGSRELSKHIYRICKETALAKDFEMKSQIIRSSGSVMDNIAEGFEREGRKEFIQYLSISKASLGEVRSQLYRLLDQGYISTEQFNELNRLTNSISGKLRNLIQYLRSSDNPGYKYRSSAS